MVVECVTLRLSLIKERYVGHPQWDSISKSPTARANLYVVGVLGMGGTTSTRYGKIFTETACPTQSPWFGKFTIGSKLWMAVVKR